MLSLIRRYGFKESVSMIYYVIRTKLLFKNARIIRFPFDVRGKKFIKIAKGFTTGRGCRLEAYPEDNNSTTLFIGENVQLNDYVHITAMQKVIIGNNVLMASKIYISDCTHGFYAGNNHDSDPDTAPITREYEMLPVEIKENVWIGESVSILPGVTIGKGSIIGANAVVTKSIPEYSIAVGIPAKVVKRYNFKIKSWERV